MIYEYHCKECDLCKEVERPYEHYIQPVLCDKCDGKMIRTFSAPFIISREPYYNHGLGIKVRRPSDVKDHLKRVRDETGQEMFEVGNEDMKKHIKKKKPSSYELTRDEYHQAEKILHGEDQ